MSPEERIVELEALVVAQAVVIAGLRVELEALKDRPERDSGNSSLPPSRDGKGSPLNYLVVVRGRRGVSGLPPMV